MDVEKKSSPIKEEITTENNINNNNNNSSEPVQPKATLIEEFKHAFQDIWAPLVTENYALFGSTHPEESRHSLESSVMRYRN